MKKEIIDFIDKQIDYEPALLKAFISVETSGEGFDASTGKILIQFEPAVFKRQSPNVPLIKEWTSNGVGRQPEEWKAFNAAFALDSDAAMKATSIGIGQIMGFNYRRIGYEKVGDMWDDAKKGLIPQLIQFISFLKTDAIITLAMKYHNFDTMAKRYNGNGYKKYNYDVRLKKAYECFSKI